MLQLMYVVVATAMFYFINQSFSFGGFGFMHRYLLGFLIILMAVFSFLVAPRLERLSILVKEGLLMALPYGIPVLVSSFIWVFEFAEVRVMTRGFFYVLYQLIAIMVTMATLYMFGRKGIRWTFLSMCLANGILVLQVARSAGFSAFIGELLRLLVSFGLDAGDLMREVEIHDLTFAFGPFLIYFFLQRKKEKGAWLFLLAGFLFFLIGLKRIGIAAAILAIIVYMVLHCLPEKGQAWGAMTVGICIVLASFVYLLLIRYGIYDFLETKMGIDTKGRSEIYRQLSGLYDISITYWGRGLGFSSTDWRSIVSPLDKRSSVAFHNDILRLYLEVGFWGFWAWICTHVLVRLRYMIKLQGCEGGLLFLAYTIYCFVTYGTDNTFYYYYTNLAFFLLSMSYSLEEREEKKIRQRWKYEHDGI